MDIIGRSYKFITSGSLRVKLSFALRYLPLHSFEESLMASCAVRVEPVETKPQSD